MSERGWLDPLPYWPNDADRARRYRDTITARIEAIRRVEGFDGATTPWETFATPLSAAPARRALPIGLVVAIPSNVNQRDRANGRYRKAS